MRHKFDVSGLNGTRRGSIAKSMKRRELLGRMLGNAGALVEDAGHLGARPSGVKPQVLLFSVVQIQFPRSSLPFVGPHIIHTASSA